MLRPRSVGLDVVPALSLALPALLPAALADEDAEALEAAMGALNAIVKKCSAADFGSENLVDRS